MMMLMMIIYNDKCVMMVITMYMLVLFPTALHTTCQEQKLAKGTIMLCKAASGSLSLLGFSGWDRFGIDAINCIA